MSNQLINIYSLPKQKTKREEARLEVYNRVLKMCHHRIETVSKAPHGEPYTFFQIPAIVFGMPIFDTDSCCDYIMKKLSLNGFKVMYMNANLLFISWSHVKFDPEREKMMDEKIREIDFPKLLQEPSPPNNIPDKKPGDFRPIYDTPSTEKFLLT
jgi:hypothetical protein